MPVGTNPNSLTTFVVIADPDAPVPNSSYFAILWVIGNMNSDFRY
jgi:hypothetical protein